MRALECPARQSLLGTRRQTSRAASYSGRLPWFGARVNSAHDEGRDGVVPLCPAHGGIGNTTRTGPTRSIRNSAKSGQNDGGGARLSRKCFARHAQGE